jgi:ATP-dependent protease ClpP protease subunit
VVKAAATAREKANAKSKANARKKAKANVKNNNVKNNNVKTNGSKPMGASAADRPPPACLAAPDIRLRGEINQDMFDSFRESLAKAGDKAELILELTTLGGDADIGRRIAGDLQLAERHLGKSFWFIGRSTVYSAGVTIMAALPKARRGLSPDTTLLIHERKLSKTLKLDDGLASCLIQLDQVKNEIETGQRLEREGFAALAAGSTLDVEEIQKRAVRNWYVPAQEALDLGLVGFIFD